jgi:N-acetylglucosaminyldiphosphoundecaprenol N-acetyl-beta-D-mannosaminyltransferase
MSARPPLTIPLSSLSYLNASPEQLRSLLHRHLTTKEHPMFIFTPNATIAAAAAKDAELTHLLQRADVLLPDGLGILLASRLAGTPVRYRLPGIDTAEYVLQLCAKLSLPVYFLGASPGVAQQAAKVWKHRLPSLPIAGWHHGYFSAEDERRILDDIRTSKAKVVLVCLGFPMQERWIVQNAPHLPDVRLMMGLGGSFDVWSGRAARAPLFWQRAGLEWLWRCLHSPRRLRTLLPVFPYFCTCAVSRHVKKSKLPVKI